MASTADACPLLLTGPVPSVQKALTSSTEERAGALEATTSMPAMHDPAHPSPSSPSPVNSPLSSPRPPASPFDSRLGRSFGRREGEPVLEPPATARSLSSLRQEGGIHRQVRSGGLLSHAAWPDGVQQLL